MYWTWFMYTPWLFDYLLKLKANGTRLSYGHIVYDDLRSEIFAGNISALGQGNRTRHVTWPAADRMDCLFRVILQGVGRLKKQTFSNKCLFNFLT